MELITGTAKTPHVTSTQHRAIYEMIIGEGSYILGKGELLEPELQSNNVLRIRSGMLCHHGSISEVKQNTYDEVNIGNGSQGMKRIDLVVARYTKNPETKIETMTWEVIQGTPAADSPVAPAYTEGNMQDGDLTDDCPLFEVHLDGIQVTEVVKLLEVLNGSLAELNSKHDDSGWINMTPAGNFSDMLRFRKIGNVVYVCGGLHFSDNGAFFDDQLVGTVPSGMVPQSNYNTYGCIIPIAQHDGTGNIARVYIRPDNGRIYITGTGSARNITLSIASYLTDD